MKSTSLKKMGNMVYWMAAMCFWECLSHGAMFEDFLPSFRYAVGFAVGFGLLLSVLTGVLPKKWSFGGNFLMTCFLILLYGSQMVYCFIFGTPYSVSQMGMGADAITGFWREMLSSMAEHFLWLLGLFLPLVLLLLLKKWKFLQKPGAVRGIAAVLLSAAVFAGVYFCVLSGGKEMFSDYYFLTSPASTTAQTADRFGIPMTFLMELRPQTVLEEMEGEGSDSFVIAEPVFTEPALDAEEEVMVEGENALDFDFEALSASTEKGKLIKLNDYISQRQPSKKNAYTGMLRDYNLIVICAESFSPAAVHPELTPTLYKLTHEGFVFENYYNSFPNTTIDGEYALVQGLFPDASRGKANSSMLSSSDHYLPYTLGNIFAEQLGIHSYGYHNNIGRYYDRNVSHPNLGYEMKFNHSGMELGDDWPTSDLEMMEQTVDDYIHEDRFHAYYMTFSGHCKYDVSLNSLSKKNYEAVKSHSEYNTAQKCYLACHIELDKALEYLMTRLEEEGKLDHTAIVMAGDHFPYGLYKDEYFGLIGQEENSFLKYKSNLVLWVGGMEETIPVDAYCCNVDVLPTILNLWGLDYDSRMLAGTDILSDSMHVAILVNHTFLTDKVWYNPDSGKKSILVDESELPEDYIAMMNQLVSARFDMSAQILQHDYYRFAYGK